MSVIIVMNNTGARIVGADMRATAIVSDLLSYDVEGARFSAGFKLGTWNGKQTFLRVNDMTFDAGFVPMVRQALAENGYPVSVKDMRVEIPPLGPAEPNLIGIELREYQLEAVRSLLRHRRGVIQIATGGGKTEVAIAATQVIGRKTLFLTHKLDLVRQTRARYQKRLGRHTGMISEGEWLPAEITVATVQTIMANCTRIWEVRGKRKVIDNLKTAEAVSRAKAKNGGEAARDRYAVYLHNRDGSVMTEDAIITAHGLTEKEVIDDCMRNRHFAAVTGLSMIEDRIQQVLDFLRSIEFLIVDEAHRSSGSSFFKIISTCSNAYYRASLTATPLMKDNREEDLKLIACSGDIIHRISNNDLIELGYAARPYFTFVEVPKFEAPAGGAVSKLAYPAAYAAGIVENPIRNALVVEETVALSLAGRRTVVLVKEIKHGTILYGLLKAAGVRCRWVSGRDDGDDRQAALEALTSGEITTLVASTILDEGLDCPAISAIVLAGGGKAKISLFQRVGRSVRVKEDDNTAKVIDFIDSGDKRLMKHSALRFKAVQDEAGWVIEKLKPWSARTALAA